MAGPVLNPDGSLLFKYSINGGENPTDNPDPPGPKPWLTALIKQAGADAVDIILTPSLGDEAYAISWGFNMKPSEIEDPLGEPLYLPGDFTYSCSASGIKDPCFGMGPISGIFDDKSGDYIWNPNKVNMQNGWKGFDMEFLLPNEKANRLDDGTILTIRVGREGITPGAFNYPVVGDFTNGEFTAVHVGGYGYSTTLLDDPLVGTPVPGPLPILGAVTALQASRRLRRRLKSVQAPLPANQPV